tara:strand:- start:167140 stop:167640 length:501 start_codon:yes stop_codon:yes gene_type:complete
VYEIINTGKEIWKVVKDNKPKVNLHINAANALPKNIDHWSSMECWMPTAFQKFRITYDNIFNIEVLKLEFKVQYTYGGQWQGQGHYLKNVTVIPTKVEVAWAHELNVSVHIDNIVNLNSVEFPIAGMEVNLFWDFENPVNHVQESESYFINGQGHFMELNQWTVPQ